MLTYNLRAAKMTMRLTPMLITQSTMLLGNLTHKSKRPSWDVNYLVTRPIAVHVKNPFWEWICFWSTGFEAINKTSNNDVETFASKLANFPDTFISKRQLEISKVHQIKFLPFTIKSWNSMHTILNPFLFLLNKNSTKRSNTPKQTEKCWLEVECILLPNPYFISSK